MRRAGALTALVCEGFASRIAFGVLSFAVPLYGRSLGMSIAAIGVLASLEPVVAILLKPVLGRLVDRTGLRRSLLAGSWCAASSASGTCWPAYPGSCTPSRVFTAPPMRCGTRR